MFYFSVGFSDIDDMFTFDGKPLQPLEKAIGDNSCILEKWEVTLVSHMY